MLSIHETVKKLIIRIPLTLVPTHTVTHKEVKRLFSSNDKILTAELTGFNGSSMGSLLSMDETWKLLRSNTTNAISEPKKMVDAAIEGTMPFWLDHVKSWREGEPADVHKVLARICAANIILSLFKTKTDWLLSEEFETFNKTLLHVGSYLRHRVICSAYGFRYWKWFPFLTPKWYAGELAYCRDFANRFLESEDIPEGSFLDELRKSSLSKETQLDEVIGNIWAAICHATPIALCLYEIAINEEVQALAREEANLVMEDREIPNSEDVLRMPFIQAVVKEALRKWPLYPILARSVGEDEPMGLKHNTHALVSPWVMHRYEEWWTDPATFNPTRFLEDGEGTSNPCYMPFGAGPRACPFQKFILYEYTALVATAVKAVKFATAPDFTPELNYLFVIHCANGVPIQATA